MKQEDTNVTVDFLSSIVMRGFKRRRRPDFGTGSPWEDGYIDSFNGKLRDELLNREIFTTRPRLRY